MQKVVTGPFRQSFKDLPRDAMNWFPGHMEKGLKQMQHKLRSVDCIIEVHDARIPLSGRNSDFKYKISGVKPHILVLNKVDLIEKWYKKLIKDRLKEEYEHIIFTECKNQKCGGVKELLPLVQNLISNSDRFNRTGEEDYCVMIIGIPNVGKSSLLNALRVKNLNKGNATSVGAVPGITRSVLHKIKINEKPLIYMLDTPGILTPNIPSSEVGLKLALCATIQDYVVGENVICDYLLYWLNKQENFSYVDAFSLKRPTDDIYEVLKQICVNSKKIIRVRDPNNNYIVKPDLDAAAKFMLGTFRTGQLGKIMLDGDIIKARSVS